jgi:6-phosphogluconolactonase
MMKYYFLFAVIFLLSGSISRAQQHYLVTGTYTGGKSEGIYVHRFNSEDGTASIVGHVKTSNPSFVAVSPDQQYVYAVQENGAANGKGGAIAAFSFNKQTGLLSFMNSQSTGGDHPCYVAVDKTGKWVVAGNYSSGSISVMPVLEDGSLGAAGQVIKHSGSGPDIKRQSSPHVHCTYFSADNRFLFVPDLGIDKVMIYSFDKATGKLKPAAQPFAASAAGAGPRHISFHPSDKYAYVIEELSGTVSVFEHIKGKLRYIQRISSMAKGNTGTAGSADIHVSPSGRFLYASNRAEANNIAIFSIDPSSGKLKLIAHQSTLGRTPRNFSIDPSGNYLLAANQNSDEIVVFKTDLQTGLLSDTGNRIAVGKPVCLVWIPVR